MANIINPYRFGSGGGGGSGGGSDYVTISTSATINEDGSDSDYNYIEFDATTTGAFEVTDAGSSSGSDSIELYVIGGGGGGGAQTSYSNVGTGGGAGAGGFLRHTTFTNGSSLAGTYDVTIGAGGGAGSSNSTYNTNGSDSYVNKQSPTERSIDIASGDYFSADASSNFDFGTGDYTIEFWMKTDLSVNTSNWQMPFRVGSMQFFMGTTSAYVQPYWGGSPLFSSGNGFITSNVWQHFALTRASGTTRLYINGVNKGSTTTSTDFGTSGSNYARFGYNQYQSSGYYTMAGRFAGIRIYKGTAKYTGTSSFNPYIEKPEKETNVTLLINPDSSQSDITDSSDGSNSFTDNITWSSDLETDVPFMRGFGGGRSASYHAVSAGQGGSGGGGSYSPNAGALGVMGQGNSGGIGNVSSPYQSGGGGGAGGSGSSGSSGGDGGDGWSDDGGSGWMSYNSLGPDGDGYFAGGGGGGKASSSGGSGGGGAGGLTSSDDGTDGAANSGGGGGGAGKSNYYYSGSGGAGGSGKVIVRWKNPNQ